MSETEHTTRKPRSDKGKPRPHTTTEAALMEPVSRETEAHGNIERPERISIGARQTKLDALARSYIRAGYHLCFVLDDQKGNLERFELAWYSFVTKQGGDHVTFPSGPFRVHLMEIEQRYYDDDRRLLEEETSARMKAKIKLGPDEYAPDERSSAGGSQALTRHGVTDPTVE